MRTLVFGGAIMRSSFSRSRPAAGRVNPRPPMRRSSKADKNAISEIEEKFHESISKKDIAQMMSLWAPHATFSCPGKDGGGHPADPAGG